MRARTQAAAGPAARRQARAFDVAARSHRGKVRQENEDAWLAKPEIGLFAVIDGMGGARAGALAARLARDSFAERRPTCTAALRGAFEAAHEAISDHASRHPEDAGLGCVATAALVRGARLTLAHVGDTRAYLASKAGCQQLTRDHTVVAEMQERHAMTEADADALPGRHRVTRDVGSGGHQGGAAWVDLVDGEIAIDDVLLLASDGLTDLVDGGEIARLLGRAREDAESSLERVAERFIELSLERGAHDNVTVVLVRRREHAVTDDTETIALPVPVRRDSLVGSPAAAEPSRRRLARAGAWLGGVALGVALGLGAATLVPRLGLVEQPVESVVLVEGSDPATAVDVGQLGGRFEVARAITALGPLGVPGPTLTTEVAAGTRLELRGLDLRFPETPSTWTLRLEPGATLVLRQASIRAPALDLVLVLGAGARVQVRDSHLALAAIHASGAADASIVRSGGHLELVAGAPTFDGPSWNDEDAALTGVEAVTPAPPPGAATAGEAAADAAMDEAAADEPPAIDPASADGPGPR